MNCNIRNFRNGIVIEENSPEAFIEYNKIHDNRYGIYSQTSSSTINRNIIFNNVYGMLIYTLSENTIFDNFFFNNTYHGDDIGDYHTYNITKTSGTNIIGGPYKGGNYWDTYTGSDTSGDGLGDTNTPYTDSGRLSGDYLPLVDIISPKYFNVQGPTGSIPYNSSATYTFNITWQDNTRLGNVILELDGINYTTLQKSNEFFGFGPNHVVQHKATYSANFTSLKAGTHHYRWYANDTAGNWNSTQLFNFTIGYPDIAIQNVTFSNLYPKINETITVSVKVANLGNATATFNLILGYTKPFDPIIGNFTVTLEPNQILTVNYTWTPTTTGTHKLTAYITNILNDINPANNQKTAVIYVEFIIEGGSTSTKIYIFAPK